MVFLKLCFIPMVSTLHKIILPPDYRPDEKPPGDPLVVRASLNLRNIISVSEITQTISLETTLRLYWKDSRIGFEQDSGSTKNVDSTGLPYALLPHKEADTIWMPDIFLDQAINIRRPKIFAETASIRIHNDSSIRYSSRFVLLVLSSRFVLMVLSSRFVLMVLSSRFASVTSLLH